ncbi:M23 family metallopeptidase [Wenjunlia tyrosinilytica]|nr:M23 family metallopeptidase [Wenjunlia tyrosinilytica]
MSALTDPSTDASYGYYAPYGQQGAADATWGGRTGFTALDDPLFGALPGTEDPSYQSMPGHEPGMHADYGAQQGHSAGYEGYTAQTWPTEATDTSAYGVPLGYDTTGAYDTGYATGYETTYGTAEYTYAQQGEYTPYPEYGTTGYAQEQHQHASFEPHAQHHSEPHHAEQEQAHGHDADFDFVFAPDPADAENAETSDYETSDYGTSDYGTADPEASDGGGFSGSEFGDSEFDDSGDGTEHDEPAPASASSSASSSHTPVRNRRRRAAKRSALLTVAVPSACVMGVAAVAAATVVVPDSDSKDSGSRTQADSPSVSTKTTNTKLDQQLTNMAADAGDFADRASRTQERIDLKERQAQEKKRKELEAARKEAMRPKVFIPVTRHGLSAMFGQSGVNWMALHTGIDFPVSMGTPVMAATDGTVRTQWNSAYGNMAIVTAPDGTETWYCHLSSTRIRGGSVKAGDVIAYSGSSGNSTGPHLHFEVHPGGGAAVDPLQWLLNKGLDPR